MSQCKFNLSKNWNCGSYQFNLMRHGIDQGNLCDVHYWETLAKTNERDAARYRWLRDVGDNTYRAFNSYPGYSAERADAEIDAAIAKGNL